MVFFLEGKKTRFILISDCPANCWNMAKYKVH